MAAEIELVEVTKRYPGVAAPAVDAVSLTIRAGEVVVLVGPSGCGKTTTLRMINRLIEPTSGRITLDGRDTSSLDPDRLRRGIGYAIQQAGLFPHLTVGQNVATVPGLLGWDRSRIADRVDEMLELVGLEPAEFRDRHPRQLSGGQQQRVGVARALAADPPVLLMDEPFGAVDPITRGNLQEELLRLQAGLRKTIVFVTHDFDEAVRLGDRIAVFGPRSRVLQYDTPEAILADPADDTVAGFVGAGASLKQLRLRKVREVELGRAVTARVTDEPGEVGRLLAGCGHERALLLDAHDRPVAWADVRRPGRPRPVGGAVTRESSLQDALEAILTEGGPAVVTGERGEYVGLVEVDAVIGAVRKPRGDQAGSAS